MTDLSPAAQAVRRDFAQIMRELYQRCRVSISATDALPITLETNDSSLQAGIDSLIAAALRAAAERNEYKPDMRDEMEVMFSEGWNSHRSELLAIADELDQPTP